MVEYICDTCKKKWKNKTDFTRHQNKKNPCKIYRISNVDKINLLINKINELENKMSEMEKIKPTITNNTNNNTNNTNNIINKIDNINITITPIAFGKEDLSVLTDKIAKRILSRGFKSIPEFVKTLHFNEDIPEYQNVYIPNWRDKSNILVFDGSKWNLENKDEILNDLKDKGIEYIQTKFDELDENDKNDIMIIKKIKRFLESHEEEKKIELLKKDLLLILYNNRELVEKTRKISNKTLCE